MGCHAFELEEEEEMIEIEHKKNFDLRSPLFKICFRFGALFAMRSDRDEEAKHSVDGM